MTPLRLYFGDLTHDTIGLATEVFPLNIGYVAAYAKAQFGDAVDVRLFKYVKDLEQAIDDDPPDILALSNYPWCLNISMAMFDQLAERRPEALRVMGGPNFPHGADDQRDFMAKYPLVDAYMYLDGEVPFANFVRMAIEVGDLAETRRALCATPVPGCVHLDEADALVATPLEIRLKELDEIPSPYLTGLMDPFFDGRLAPMLQTNRGCPFKCSFCHDGSPKLNKVTQFSLERAKAEIRYIADKVPSNMHSLFISDLNFGMYKRDAEICAEIAAIQRSHDYPHYIDTSTGKNSKERVIANIGQLGGALGLTMSVQSMDPTVLANIKRDNIKLDAYLDLAPSIREAKLPTVSEVILGLPGESKKSHVDGVSALLDAGIDHVTPHGLMLLNGSELATRAQREMWDFQTKFRVIQRDFTRLKNGRKVIEVEEIVVGSNTLPFEDYLYCRAIDFLLMLTNNMGFRALIRFMRQNDLKIMDVLADMLEAIDARSAAGGGAAAPESVVTLMDSYIAQNKSELWDSPEEIIEFFQDDENFQGLIEGRYGANLIFTYSARAFAQCFGDVADCVFHHAREAFRRADLEDVCAEELEQVEQFCRGRIFNLLGDDRLRSVPEIDLEYDIEAWLADPDGRPLSDFGWDGSRRTVFVLTTEQFRLVEDGLDQYGHNDIGRGKLLTRINANALWRKTMAEDEFDPSQYVALGQAPEFYKVASSTWHYR